MNPMRRNSEDFEFDVYGSINEMDYMNTETILTLAIDLNHMIMIMEILHGQRMADRRSGRLHQ